MSEAELPAAFLKLLRSLKPHGVLYCSFKYGSGERQQEGRTFTDLNESDLTEILDQTGFSHTLETWLTEDRRPDREERWLNVLVRL